MTSSLQDFLYEHRAGEDKVITHTSIQPKGKYFISTEENRRFYYLYNQYIQKHKSHTILENPISNYIPVIVDVDLKQELKQNERPKGPLYEKKHIRYIAQSFLKALESLLINVEEDLCCL